MTAVIVVLLVIVFVGVVVKNLFADGRRSGRHTSTGKLDKVKKEQSKQKSYKPVKNTTTGSTKADSTNIKIGAGTVIAGAALAHQLRKHHDHEDTRNVFDDRLDTLDDEFDDLYDDGFNDYDDTQYYEDADYDFQREAYEEEQAAYDDFIYSSDEGYD